MLLPLRDAARITKRTRLKIRPGDVLVDALTHRRKHVRNRQVGRANEVDAPVVGGDDDMVAGASGGADAVGCDLSAEDLLVGKRHPHQLAPVVRDEHRLVVEEADRLGGAASERDGVEQTSALELVHLEDEVPADAGKAGSAGIDVDVVDDGDVPEEALQDASVKIPGDEDPVGAAADADAEDRVEAKRLDGVLVDAERARHARVGRHPSRSRRCSSRRRPSLRGRRRSRRGSC